MRPIPASLPLTILGTCIVLAACQAPEAVPQPEELGVVELPVDESACTGPPDGGSPTATALQVDTVATGLDVPWDVAFSDDGRAFITERPGRIRLVASNGTLAEEPWARLDVYTEGEVGLMGIDVRRNGEGILEVYVAATHRRVDGGNLTRLARGAWRRVIRSIDPERGHPTTLRVLRIREVDGRASEPEVVIDGLPAFMLHSGGALRFGPDGFLYLSNGDGAAPWTAHDPESHRGKILRYLPDGTPQGVAPESPVFARGIRHVQGMSWHPGNEDLFVIDHGPTGLDVEDGRRDRDELSVVEPGGHLGWPIATGVTEGGGLRSAVFQWTPAIAPAGMDIDGRAESPWYGDAVVAGLRGRTLQRIALTRNGDGGWVASCGDVLSSGGYGRMRLVRFAPDGSLWVGTSNEDGRGSPRPGGDVILRIRPPSEG